MARPRTFEESEALDAAMQAFWTSGYAATSTTDLCAATGLGRSSIYNTFTGKRELFLAALGYYDAQMTQRIEAVLMGTAPAREKVRALLWQAVDAPADEPLGCLVVNTIVELGPADPEVMDLVRRHSERRRTQLVQVLRDGIAAGEIDGDRDPEAIADFVVATISGLRVAARGGAQPPALSGIADVAMAAI